MTAHRQFGSKARAASTLTKMIPHDIGIWVEGFAGTAAMTLASPPRKIEHLNDLNGDVVNLFKVMRDDAALQRLCRLVEFTPYAQEEFEACRGEVWTSDADQADDTVERARKFLVASWQGIGGKQHVRASWRLDRGRSWLIGTWSRMPDRLMNTAERLRGCFLHRRPVLDMIDMFGDRPDVFLFLDPPYPRDTLNTHEVMYAVDMSTDDHEAFAAALQGVKCRAMVTMSAGTVYDDLLSGWHVTPYPVRGMTNTVKTELAFTNYVPVTDQLFGRAA